MDSIQRYFELSNKFPSYFTQSEQLPLILEEEQIRQFSITTGQPLGVIYESPYHIFIVDLLKGETGTNYGYARLLNPNPTNGVVLIPFYQQKIVLLKQFRHGTRSFEYELPRGFSEPYLSPEKNAQKEIDEEIGATVKSIHYEGNIITDSSLGGGPVDIFSLDITAPTKFATQEGIEEAIFLTVDEMKDMIKTNQIRDSFTISAIAKYVINNN